MWGIIEKGQLRTATVNADSKPNAAPLRLRRNTFIYLWQIYYFLLFIFLYQRKPYQLKTIVRRAMSSNSPCFFHKYKFHFNTIFLIFFSLLDFWLLWNKQLCKWTKCKRYILIMSTDNWIRQKRKTLFFIFVLLPKKAEITEKVI